MGLFNRGDPDGYPETAPGWISAGTLVDRLRFVQALCIATNQSGHTDAGNCTVNPVALLRLKLPSSDWTDAAAVADYFLGLHAKKLLFIFLRGANDGLNSVIPVGDPAYYDLGTAESPKPTRPQIGLLRDPNHLVLYGATGPCADLTRQADLAGTARSAADPTYAFPSAIPLGNGFAALHPSLKFLAPVLNAGELALIHRVGYPKQSRSHFDSQNYWENGNPGNNLSKDGIFYRALLASNRDWRARTR